MTPETVAEIIRDFLDGEYADEHEASLSVRIDGASVVIAVRPYERPTQRFRAVLTEITKEEAL